MATQNPISTISYNSEAFLKEKLESLVESHTIQCYMYICHKGEDGDKDHIHLRIEPNRRIDPMSLTELLKEFVQGNSKPLGVRPWRPSKEEDWFLYVVHDADYLKFKYGGGDKGEKLPYQFTDICTSADYDVETAFIRAKASMHHSSASLASRLKKGESPLNLALSGENPYTVNALVRMLADNDYSALARDYRFLEKQFDSVLSCLDVLGFVVEFDDDGFAIGISKK